MPKPKTEIVKQNGFDPSRIGDVVRRLREARGMTQYRLAQVADVSKQAVTNLEKGEIVPSLPILYKVAGVLDIDLGDMIRTAYQDPSDEPPLAVAEGMRLLSEMGEGKRQLAVRLLREIAKP
ncbi:MAG TPA: helix-turn-helix transcriptional regulator [Terriglobales bacterium]|nr:helix-turn-helix transcriptional regulator [Terriglobales bacterium]